MKPYPEYKDTCVEWIGEIPVHWNLMKIKHSVNLINEKIENPSTHCYKIALENIESFTGKLIEKNGSFEGMGIGFVEGDVLFNKLRPYLCKVVLVKENGVAVGELLVFRVRDNIENKFLFYRLLSGDFISVVNGSTYGTKMPRTNWEFIGNLKIPLPLVSDQKILSHYLDHKTHQLDTLIEKKQKQIELLKEYRTALINQAVTKGLDPNVRMKDSGIDWLGEIPEHWILSVKLSSLAVEKRGTFVNGPFGSDLLTSELQGSGVPVIYIKDIKYGFYKRESCSFVTETKAKQLEICRVDPGDVLIAKVGDPPGTAAIYPESELSGIVTQDVIRIKVKSNAICPGFLVYIINSEYGKSLIDQISVESTRNRFALGDLKKVRILHPPVKEQKEILKYLNCVTGKIDIEIEKVTRVCGHLREYRTALISNVVTGKVDVRDEVIP